MGRQRKSQLGLDTTNSNNNYDEDLTFNGESRSVVSRHSRSNRSHERRSIFQHRDNGNNHKSWDHRGEGRSWYFSCIYGTGLVSAVSVVLYFLYHGYMETRINTPIAVPKVVVESGLDSPERYWGTYRPGVYFGTRTRHPTSLVTGLMWFVPGHYQNNMLAVRHWCDQADELPQFGWTKHDGRIFGSQRITDKKIIIQTDFVKRVGVDFGGDWSARIKVLPKNKKYSEQASLIYYVALDPEDSEGSIFPLMGTTQSLGSLMGNSNSVGGFRLHVLSSDGIILNHHYLSTQHLGLKNLKETVFKGFREYQGVSEKNRYVGLAGEVFKHEDRERRPDFVAFQVTGQVPFEIDIVYESDSMNNLRPAMLMGNLLTEEMKKASDRFDREFEERFLMESKGFSKEEINFAKAALSNMVGGIGYFYGASKVQGEFNKDPVPYWKAPLYSAVPSRSFFPRGFLWDEGFHNLLISKWDREISMDILGHWFDLMNWDGWIPREQILGVEARARVPDEFVVQHSKNANPPTLLLTLHSMMNNFKHQLSDDDFDYLSRLWPRLRTWYNWFNTTQFGEISGSYRWRGRDENSVKELNPKTLTSGLDDYPRASHPGVEERHLDLRCWMCMASGLMGDIARLIEKDPTRYDEAYNYLSDNNRLDSLHWSYNANGYMDYGLHTDGVELKKLNPNSDAVRVVHSPPKLRYVDSFGYISFFPLFLQIIDPQSSKLVKVLEDLRRTDLLWSPYGLRSLAKNSPFYLKRNTEHDPPYWRGAIWINMNYLAVRSLYYYSQTPGPSQMLATEVYKELRSNIIQNVLKEYKRTGYVWEHYNDRTGSGEGCRPFTGWSALVVLMMGETF